LSSLTWLTLEGNPLSFHPQHRTRAAQRLHDNAATGKVCLFITTVKWLKMIIVSEEILDEIVAKFEYFVENT
jgi:hypothetical protein